MREILFRGKSIYTSKWAVSVCPHGVMRSGHLCDDFIPDTVGQFTGLTDKNGKRIFEGDIVQDGYLFGKVVFATAQDGFDGMAGFMVDDIDDGLQNYNGFWHEVEVLGNIHDNPELLGGVEDG